MMQAETVIVGGGQAGSATACGLAALGRDVMLIERTAKPHHKVCGEFLSVETQTQLQGLGVDPSALGAAPIEQVAVYSSSRSVTSALPFRALSLSRYRLDDALLRRAQDSGARLKRNVAGKSVTPDGAGRDVLFDDGESLFCRPFVLATGELGPRGAHDAPGSPPDAYLAAARRLTASPIRLASIVSGLARSSRGRNLMLGAAACAPGLIGTIVRRTRLTLAADGF